MVALVLMVLLTILSVGLSGLAAVELRRSSHDAHAGAAKANARLALMQAIAQLQRTMGPDQRVSACAEILGGNPKQPHWTGAWRTTREDGTSFFDRDDLAGGLTDSRAGSKSSAAGSVIEWLVSGGGNPVAGAGAEAVTLADFGAHGRIEVPGLVMRNAKGALAGHQAWWTGDLGIRANIATRDPRGDLKTARDKPGDGAWFRLMASQAADPSLMGDGAALKDADPPSCQRGDGFPRLIRR